MKRLLKFLHELSAIGVMGALATHLVLVVAAADGTPAQAAAIREAIVLVTRWLLLPSLLVVLVTGLLSMAVHRPFLDARWAWFKALLGLAMFEGTLGAVQSNARRLAELSAGALEGRVDPAHMDEALRGEWTGLWTIMALSIANVALAVWRPKLKPRFLRVDGR